MIQQVLKEEEWRGRLNAADLRALWPLRWQHINPYGTCALNMKERLPLELVTAYLGATLPDFRSSQCRRSNSPAASKSLAQIAPGVSVVDTGGEFRG
jgi:hypothetical protein